MKVLLLSDIHGNDLALQAVLEDAEGKYDEVYLLGDYIDYGVENDKVLERLLELAKKVKVTAIAGNHDILFRDCNQSYYIPKTEHGLRSAAITQKTTSPTLFRKFMNEVVKLNTDYAIAGGVVLVHDENRLPKTDIWEKFEMWCFDSSKPSGIIFVGHNHLQYDKEKKIGGLIFRVINPGSVGQPRDGSPEAKYAIVDFDDFGELDGGQFYKVKYDSDKASDLIRKAGGHPFIANRIRIGV